MNTKSFTSLIAGFLLVIDTLGQNDQVRASQYSQLQGTWKFTVLEMDGMPVSSDKFTNSTMVVTSNRFAMTSTDGIYRGTFTIDSAKTPKTIDMHFTEGPNNGETALGIYELNKLTWRICLGLAGKARPTEFTTKAGGGTALEVLEHTTGTAHRVMTSNESATKLAVALDPELLKMQGEWSMLAAEKDGQKLPDQFLTDAKRLVKGDMVTVTMTGMRFWQARVVLNTNKQPHEINYEIAAGPSQGKKQFGIYEWDGDKLRICFADPGKDRPTDFTTQKDSGRSSSVWAPKKQ